ncbi:Rrf2 family transcriptional regulator [bacterium]|nr:Rrf2 family transcriptional regulator [bacterium]NBT60803.1 Rrf2 family transcriptional regulator [Planctomycetia bacterium]
MIHHIPLLRFNIINLDATLRTCQLLFFPFFTLPIEMVLIQFYYYIVNDLFAFIRVTMSFFSRKMDYALLVLSHLHGNPDGSSAREISAKFSISRPFLANIMKTLCHHGYLSSHRGVHGGYVLIRKPKDIALADIMQSLDEPFHLTDCSKDIEKQTCSARTFCPIRTGMSGVHDRIRTILKDVTLAEILDPTIRPSVTLQFGLELVSHGTNK